MSNYKLLIFLFLLSGCTPIYAQNLEEYLSAEQTRLIAAESKEADIAKFISDNLDGYELSEDLIEEINSNLDDGMEYPVTLTEGELENLYELHKKEELRKLYFELFPDAAAIFKAIEAPAPLQTFCINGGFEAQNGYANYTFESYTTNSPDYLTGACQNPQHIVFNPTGINQMQNEVTLVSPGNETILAALNPPILVPRVNAGMRSLKINPTPNNPPGNPFNDGEKGNTTTVSRIFVVDENRVDFNYLMIGKRVTDGHRVPQFNVRIYNNATGTLIPNSAICIDMATTNCSMVAVNDTRSGWPVNEQILYTPNWLCQTINTTGLIGTQVRVEFTVSDCLMRGHFGTVYIDNVCGMHCPTATGSINLNPIDVGCPTTSFQVCGDFVLPANSTALTALDLNILDSSMNIVTTISNPALISPFCFTVNPSDFGTTPTGNYTFQVVATHNDLCAVAPTMAKIGGTVTFADCSCQPNMMLSGSCTVSKEEQTSDWIVTTEQISNSTTRVIYHADNYIELNTDFETQNSAEFAAYIKPCPFGFDYKHSTASNDNSKPFPYKEPMPKSRLVKVNHEIRILPNPSNKLIAISYGKELSHVIIYSMDGKTVYTKEIASLHQEIDVSGFENGIYLVTVKTKDGKILQSKFVKN